MTMTIMNEDTVESNKHLLLGDPLATDRFIKVNNIQEVNDPIFFIRDGVPSPKGLLSYEIFGITKDERANTFAYIDLADWFLHPLVYKKWSQKDRRIKEIVHGTKTFSIGTDGDFVEDPKGSTGVRFLKNNIDKIKIKRTDSKERDDIINYIYKYKKYIFIDKLIVLPAFYRDVSTKSGSRVSVGELNKTYQQIIINANSLRETADYGLSMDQAVKGRMQELILTVYNSLTGTGENTDGVGLSKKSGLVRSAVMSKTTDYGTRLVLSAPQLKVERLEDLMVDMDHAALPLSSACVNFMPYVIFNIKRFFENEFITGSKYKVIINNKIEYVEIKDPLIIFSEEEIIKQIKRYIYGFSNRFIPVEIPLENGKVGYALFKGHKISTEDYLNGNIDLEGETTLINRKLTWLDVIYIASCEAVKDKHIKITRFPIDSAYNTIFTKVRISTINETENIYLNGEFYRWYPKFRNEQIGMNTSHTFIDTLNISNLHLGGMGGDYDGDTTSICGVWSVEANEELDKHLNSKKNIIDIGGENIKKSSNEAIQCIYSLTRVLYEDLSKLTNPNF